MKIMKDGTVLNVEDPVILTFYRGCKEPIEIEGTYRVLSGADFLQFDWEGKTRMLNMSVMDSEDTAQDITGYRFMLEVRKPLTAIGYVLNENSGEIDRVVVKKVSVSSYVYNSGEVEYTVIAGLVERCGGRYVYVPLEGEEKSSVEKKFIMELCNDMQNYTNSRVELIRYILSGGKRG